MGLNRIQGIDRMGVVLCGYFIRKWNGKMQKKGKGLAELMGLNRMRGLTGRG